MAVKTYRLATSVVNNFGELLEADQAVATSATGWTVGKLASPQSANMDIGVEQTTGAFSSNATTAKPTALVTGTTANAFRTSTALSGVFANTNWSIVVPLRSVTAVGGTVRVRLRVYKSANADGTGATELTGATQVGTTSGALATGSDVNSTVTWAPGGTITLTNEYLFFAIALEVVTAGGSNTSDALLRHGTSANGVRVVTPDFANIFADTGTGDLRFTPSSAESYGTADSATCYLYLLPRMGDWLDPFDTSNWTLTDGSITGGKAQKSIGAGASGSVTMTENGHTPLDGDFEVKMEIPDKPTTGTSILASLQLSAEFDSEGAMTFTWQKGSGSVTPTGGFAFLLQKAGRLPSELSGTELVGETSEPGVDCPQWLRMRRVGTDYFWDSSVDGVNWTNRKTYDASADGGTFRRVRPRVVVGRFSADGSAETVSVDNFQFDVPDVDVFAGADSATIRLSFTPSGVDDYTAAPAGTEYTDSGTVGLTLTPSGTEERTSFDTGTVGLVFTPSATEGIERTDSGTVTLALTVVTATQSYDDVILSDSPVYYWKQHEPSGSTVEEDISNTDGTYVNTPTLGEPALTADGVSSVHFNDASDEYANLGAIFAQALYDVAFSMEIWFKRDGGSTGLDQGIFGSWLSGDSGGPLFWLDHLTGRLRGVYNLASLANYLDSGVVPAGGDVHYVTMTYDGTTQILKLYLDGALVDTKTGITGLGGTNSWNIARYNADGNLCFAGHTERAAIYDTVLTLARVQAHYEAGIGATAPPDTAQFVDTGTITLAFTPSGVDEYSGGLETTDSGTVVLAFVPSGTELIEATDQGTVSLVLTASGTEVREITDTGTALLTLSPSGTDVQEFAESATVRVELTPSGTEFQTREYADSDTIPILFTPSSTDTAQYVDSATVTLVYTVSGTEVLGAVESATVDLRFTPTGTDEYAGVSNYVDSATVILAFTPTYTETLQAVDSNQLYVALSPSGNDTLERATTDSATATVSLVPSGIEYSEFDDTATISLAFTPSGTDTLDTTSDALVRIQLTPSGVDQYGQIFEYVDTGTLYLHLTPVSTGLVGMQLTSRAFLRYRSRISGRWASRSFKRVLSKVS
jgi:hypothetical protein